MQIVHKDASLSKTRNPHLLRQLPCRRAGAARAEQRAFEQLSLGLEAGKLPGPSSHHAPVREHASLTCVLHQSRPRYTMLDWHPSAQIKMARLEPRVTTTSQRWRCGTGACCHVSSGSGTSFNRCAREGAKRRGRGDEMCSAWSRSIVDHDKACCHFEVDLRRLDARSCSAACIPLAGVVMASSAWVLARRGRCGSCMVLMTKKVD